MAKKIGRPKGSKTRKNKRDILSEPTIFSPSFKKEENLKCIKEKCWLFNKQIHSTMPPCLKSCKNKKETCDAMF